MHARHRVSLLLITTVFACYAVAAPQSEQDHLLREQKLQEAIQNDVDIRLQTDPVKPIPHPIQNESPCFPVQQIVLTGEHSQHFQFALRHAVKQSGFHPGVCLGDHGINRIMTFAQNAVIEHGYTTTRILAAPQNLGNGRLVLTVIPGKIRQIIYRQGKHTERIIAFQNEFPIRSGDILNIRNIEQGLENIKRLPTVEADISIEPAETPDQSDIVVVWSQRLLPYRIMLSVDDGGSRSTGRYQGNIALSADNPFGMSDMFYVSVGKDLGDRDDLPGTNSGTANYSLHYSVPVGKWLLSLDHSHYTYHQAVAGLNENYDYSGKSNNTHFGLSRLLHRNANSKTYFNAKVWKRSSQNFINDAQIDVQRRRMAGWQAGIEHKHYLGKAVFDVGLNYRHGTGALDSMRAPEEAFGEGTSRMRIITADIGLYAPFSIKKQQFVYDTNFHGQWNKTPLITQDKLSIGGRYTVRGFDGEVSLMGDRGWYWQNTLGWQYHRNHQIYVGADIGHVSGPSTEYQLGQTLAGAVVGVKGQFAVGGNLHYDVFAGKPLSKPAYFKTDNTTYGFSLNYSF